MMELVIRKHLEGDLWNLQFVDPEMDLKPENINIEIEDEFERNIISLDKLIIAYRIVKRAQSVNKALTEYIK